MSQTPIDVVRDALKHVEERLLELDKKIAAAKSDRDRVEDLIDQLKVQIAESERG